MGVTNAVKQEAKFKKKIEKFYVATKECMHKKGECPIKDVLAPTVDKWSLFCMYNLAYVDLIRFNDLKKKIPGISSRMLSVTLKKLEQAKLINRKLYPEVPPRVEYSITSFGKAYAEKLLDLNLWLFDNRSKFDSVKNLV